jgi:hypothetical protein
MPVVRVQAPDNGAMLTSRRLATSDMATVTAIVTGLPDYFTSDVLGRVQRDATAYGGWVLADGDGAAAFAVIARRPPAAAENRVMSPILASMTKAVNLPTPGRVVRVLIRGSALGCWRSSPSIRTSQRGQEQGLSQGPFGSPPIRIMPSPPAASSGGAGVQQGSGIGCRCDDQGQQGPEDRQRARRSEPEQPDAAAASPPAVGPRFSRVVLVDFRT